MKFKDGEIRFATVRATGERTPFYYRKISNWPWRCCKSGYSYATNELTGFSSPNTITDHGPAKAKKPKKRKAKR